MHAVLQLSIGVLLVCAKLTMYALSLGIGLSLGPDEWRAGARPAFLARALMVAVVAVPALAILIVHVLPVPPLGAGLLLLMAVAPGSPMIYRKTRKDPAGAGPPAVLALVLMLASVVMLPVSLAVLSALLPYELDADPAQIVRRVLIPFVVPLLAGVLLRRLAPRTARALEPWAARLFQVGFGVLVVVALVKGIPIFPKVDVWAIVAAVLLTVGSLLLGALAGGERPEDRRLLGTAAAFGNPPLALAVAATGFPSPAFVPALAAYLLVRALVLAVGRAVMAPSRPGESRRRGRVRYPSGRATVDHR